MHSYEYAKDEPCSGRPITTPTGAYYVEIKNERSHGCSHLDMLRDEAIWSELKASPLVERVDECKSRRKEHVLCLGKDCIPKAAF